MQECEELREKAETLKSLEEDASEENEILKFKVLSLESESQMKGVDLSEIKIVDELKHQNKELKNEVKEYKRKL